MTAVRKYTQRSSLLSPPPNPQEEDTSNPKPKCATGRAFSGNDEASKHLSLSRTNAGDPQPSPRPFPCCQNRPSASMAIACGSLSRRTTTNESFSRLKHRGLMIPKACGGGGRGWAGGRADFRKSRYFFRFQGEARQEARVARLETNNAQLQKTHRYVCSKSSNDGDATAANQPPPPRPNRHAALSASFRSAGRKTGMYCYKMYSTADDAILSRG